MPRSSLLLAASLAFLVSPFATAQDESSKADVKAASSEPAKALKSLKVAPGFKVELFAAEPLLANPVSFDIDDHGRFYVVETFRHSDGVTDTRGHMNWLDDDLASRSVADRVAMYRKFFKPEEFARYSKQEDRIRLVEDTDGDGKADKATVFADGFRLPETGLAAGVLARGKDVYFTCIPDLWLLRDTDGDGRADERTSLQNGYGVHVGFLGHDLHGLTFGPDGRLYFSIGDRGFNVKTIDGKTLSVPDTGSVLRCDPDGANLEVFAYGLRNPQELVFTETGDLFTVDNNSDGGDKARLVNVLEGSDSGWRIGYQFIEKPNSRGIWNSEKMWHPQWDGQAAYILPPLANFTDGPSGFAYYPGTGLNASQKGRFYISDFRGAANTSGIRSFKVKPKGATFALDDPNEFLWGFEVTDCGFGPDGALYATDWVQGWDKNGKGRIWKVTDATGHPDPAIAETRTLLAEDFAARSPEKLAALLANPDQRVRQKAQFALAESMIAASRRFATEANPVSMETFRAGFDAMRRLAIGGGETVPRLHSLWGIGQVLRQEKVAQAQWLIPIQPLLRDPDAEVRAHAAQLLSEFRACKPAELAELLNDPSPRVRLFAAMGLGRLGSPSSVAPIAAWLRSEDGRDPYLRHAAVMGFAGISEQTGQGAKLVADLGSDPSANVRMAVLLTLRRAGDPGVSRSLDDPDPAIVLEAARAVSEIPAFADQLPVLADLATKPLASEALARRVVAACEAIGDAKGLVAIAARGDVPEAVRVESLQLLGAWRKPSRRHPITGLARAVEARPSDSAVAALLPALPKLVSGAPDRVRTAAAKAAAALDIKEAAPALRALVADGAQPAESRVEALRALDALKDEKLDDVAHAVMKDENPSLRVEAVRIVAENHADEAIGILRGVLDDGPTIERQGAFATLADIKDAKADAVLETWLDKLASGEVAPEVRLDLTEAASERGMKDKLAKYESTFAKDDPLATYRDSLAGGDASRGRRVFREKAEVQCLRCHKVEGDGGEVGPELTGIGATKDRAYLLESIVLPNKQIAEGFETTLIAKTDGQVVSGIVKAQDDKEIRLITAEGKLLTIPKSEIDETTRGSSAMPEDIIKHLTKSELRDVIEFLATTKAAANPGS